MDDRDDLYEKIVEEYKKTGSVKQVVENLGSNTIKVRRVLITEGLWESNSSRSVGELYRQGKSVKEIAEALNMTEKNVQSYMPYTRGAYGGAKSDDATRSEEYRSRMHEAADKQAILQEGGEVSFENVVVEKRAADNIVDLSKITERKKMVMEETNRLPSVLKLRFELISPFNGDEADDGLDMDEEEKAKFFKNAKAKEGIIREVLVPGEMNLHCLHYMIQRLFGWQNSHLHKYSLSATDFSMVTNNTNIDEYMNLCGTIFRYPGSELDDQFWDDDYEDEYSIKSWLKSKYYCGFVDLAVENAFIRNREYVRGFVSGGRIKSKQKKTLDELRREMFFENDFNTLIESIPVRQLFVTAVSKSEKIPDAMWRSLQRTFIQHKQELYDELEREDREEYNAILQGLEDLLETRKSIISFQRGMHAGQAKDIKKQFGRSAEDIIYELEDDLGTLEHLLIGHIADGNPVVIPFADSIYYCYDFGDDWTVKITCVDAYTSEKDYDWSNPKAYNQKSGNRIEPKAFLNFKNVDGETVPGSYKELLHEVYIHGMPQCVYADGLSVMDDVGGIYGFASFLERLNGDDPKEVEDSKSWARWMGWTGRKTKPENMLK